MAPRRSSLTTSSSTPCSDSEDTACETCGFGDDEGMLLCELCERGYHMTCLDPPLAEVPGGNWFCPLCENLRRSDARFKETARVRVFWPAYDAWYIGWVIGVRAATDDETAEQRVPLGTPIYHIFYDIDDQPWQFLNESEFLPFDKAATTLAKDCDPLLGRRIEVWHSQTVATEAGWYPGIVNDVRVEQVQRFAAKNFHLVQYDAGDVQWHDLAAVRWQHENPKQRVIKAAFGVNSFGQHGVKRKAEGGMGDATVARKALDVRAAQAVEAVPKKEAQIFEFFGKRLERALLFDTRAASALSEVVAGEHGDADSAAMLEEFARKEQEARTAEFETIKSNIEASRGDALVGLLRSLVRREVGRELLVSSGVGKLVGRVSRQGLQRLPSQHISPPSKCASISRKIGDRITAGATG